MFRHIWCHDSDLTWPEQPQLSPCKVEAKWKLNERKTQCRGSDKKPTVLKTGTAKTNKQQKAHGAQYQIPEDLQLRNLGPLDKTVRGIVRRSSGPILRKSGTVMEAALSWMEKEPDMQ